MTCWRCATCARRIAYGRIVFTSFIAYSFGHTLGFAAFTGAAIRFRSVCDRGRHCDRCRDDLCLLQPLDRHRACRPWPASRCSCRPNRPRRCLHLRRPGRCWSAHCCSPRSSPTRFGRSLSRSVLEIRGWALRAPGPADRHSPQIALGIIDLGLSGAVLWWLLPADAHIGFIAFVGAYAVAVIAGIISHVPGGIGVFETVMLLHPAGRSARGAAGLAAGVSRDLLPRAAVLSARCCSAAKEFERRSVSIWPGPASCAGLTSRPSCRRSRAP